MGLVEYPVAPCDYCGAKRRRVRASPYMADVGARACRQCWNDIRERGKQVEGVDVGPFRPPQAPGER